MHTPDFVQRDLLIVAHPDVSDPEDSSLFLVEPGLANAAAEVRMPA